MYRFIKRLLDILLSGFAILVLSPLLIPVCIILKCTGEHDIFYGQDRIGFHNKHFKILKFATMLRNSPNMAGGLHTTHGDSRVLPFGKFLRKTRIDELPQILCVLKGDMSMVGPRPERAVFIAKLREEIPFYISRLKMKPGLTGWAQVCHHYDTSTEDVKIKLRYDMYYFENMSLLLDFQILVRTVYVVLTGKGAQ